MSEQPHSRGTTRVCLTRCPLPPPEANVHCLPCRIHYDGKAPVKNYFRPEPLTSRDHVQDVSALDGTHATKLRAEFRGIQLQGEQCDVRALGYQGLVLEDSGLTHPDDEGKVWEVDHHFDAFTYWDVPNNTSDETLHLPTALRQWTQLAHALHDDVEDEP